MKENNKNFESEERVQTFEGEILGRARRDRTVRGNPLFSFDMRIQTEEGTSRRTVVRRKALTKEASSHILKGENVKVLGIPYVVRQHKQGKGNKPLYRISALQITFTDGSKA
jgi:hypothetical protein